MSCIIKDNKLINGLQFKYSQTIMYEDFHEEVRNYFNVLLKGNSLALTLLNPNIHLDAIKLLVRQFAHMDSIQKYQVAIMQNFNFDDQLLTQFSNSIPKSATHLTFDFSSCQSIKGEGILDLFQKISQLNLIKLHLDFSEITDLNDIVFEGLNMLLESQSNLQEFYLDLYEISKTTEEGYLMLAEGLSHLHNLKSLHLDFSSNEGLSEDALELIFDSFSPNLTSLTFRIADVDSIGGGSFYKLAESLSQMHTATSLSLKISSLSNLDPQIIPAVLKSINKLQNLVELKLQLGDINLKTESLKDLNFAVSVNRFDLDISCNSLLGDSDILNLMTKMTNIVDLSLNIDFCKVSEDSMSQFCKYLFNNGKCQSLNLPDRIYQSQFSRQLMHQSILNKNIINLNLNVKEELQSHWLKYKYFQLLKRKTIYLAYLLKKNKSYEGIRKDILEILV